MAVLSIKEQVPIAPFTSLGIGGPARYFATIRDAQQLPEAVRFARAQHLPLFVLGGGSNLLVADEGFRGLVLHMQIDGELEQSEMQFRSPAGMNWDLFVRRICEQGISGVECLAGIPGLVGGSPIQNIGAYGQEVAQTIQSVSAIDLHTLEFVELPSAACCFSYRQSLFNAAAKGRYIVTGVTFQFERDAKPTLTYPDLARRFSGASTPQPLEVYEAVRAIRAAKGMLLDPDDADSRSAGSFFKNPVAPLSTLAAIACSERVSQDEIPHWPASGESVKLAAAWLVEHAGFHRGDVQGNAGISSKHTLALVNRGGATYADMARLRDRIITTVAQRFGVHLIQEPVELGVDAAH